AQARRHAMARAGREWRRGGRRSLRGHARRRGDRDLRPVLAAFRGRRPRAVAHHRSTPWRASGRCTCCRQRHRDQRDAGRRLVHRADRDGPGGWGCLRPGARPCGPAVAGGRACATADDAGIRGLHRDMTAIAPTVSPRWPALLGNVAMLAALLVAALALLPLHNEPWWPASPRPRHWWLAAGSLVAYLTAVAWLLLR